MRASDADRDRTAEHLRASHVEGRLDLAEFQQRLDSCYAAKTTGDLDVLVRDLPRRREPAELGLTGWLRRRAGIVAAAGIFLAATLLAGVAGHHAAWHIGWLWIPVVFLVWRLSPWRRGRGRFGPPHGWTGGR